MRDLIQPAVVFACIIFVLRLAGSVLNGPRARRWKRRAEAVGQATCRDCGHIGELSYGLLPGQTVTSANIQLVCANCHGENWFAPGSRRDPDRKGIERLRRGE